MINAGAAMTALHILVYAGRDADLAERWVCLTCGRVLLIDWPHRWRDVRVAGDETAAHTGMR